MDSGSLFEGQHIQKKLNFSRLRFLVGHQALDLIFMWILSYLKNIGALKLHFRDKKA